MNILLTKTMKQSVLTSFNSTLKTEKLFKLLIELIKKLIIMYNGRT